MAFAQHYTSSYGDLARKLVDEKLWKAGVGAINGTFSAVSLTPSSKEADASRTL